MNKNSPLMEHEPEGDDIDDYEEATGASGCDCAGLLCFGWRRINGNERKNLLQNEQECRETWWMKKLNKVKEFSEPLAGPKWKNFIRKISGYFNNKKHKNYQNRFQYDPQSYALNFDTSVDHS